MSSNVVNQVPYLRTSRDFPQEAQPLSQELSKAYIDIANVVNNRIIGLFPTSTPGVTGESWFVGGGNSKQQTLRRVYPFTGSSLTIAHGITTTQISGFVRIWGTFSDNSGNFYPIPYVDPTAANNQINIQITSANIVITAGAGSPPAINSGYIILEWLANA